MATARELKEKIEATYPGCVYDMLERVPKQVTVRFTDLATEQNKLDVQAIIDTFDWDFPVQNLPLFYDLLVQAVLTGQLPEDLVGKAELVNKILDVNIRNQAILSLASNPLYSQAQVDVLVSIANASGVELPPITANPNAPQLSAFITAVWSDLTIPGPIRMLIGEKESSFKQWIAAGPLGAQVILDAWDIIKSQIDPTSAGKIEVHAATYNIPIV